MRDSYDGDLYEVKSISGRCLGVVYRAAPDQREGRYGNFAGREHAVRGVSAAAVANLMIVNVELCD